MALFLDDVHWADAASVELIGHLVRRFHGPLLGAFAFRRPPARLAAAFVAVERGGFGSGLRLSPLSADEAQALLGTDLDGAIQARLYRESGGNPFYLEQLARAARTGARGPVGEADQPSGSWSPPAVVAAAIREELVQLSAEARLALDAVAGESFEPELVAAIADRPPSLALGVLDELVEADVIRPSEAPRRFRFRHPIVRTVVYEGMPSGWRLGAHARAAAALAADQAPAVAYAHHVERSARAGDEDAIALLVHAARTAAPRAPLTAGRWLRAALRLLRRGAERERHLDLLSESAAAFAAAGAYDDALEAVEDALVTVPRRDVGQRASLIVRIADVKQHSVRRFESQVMLKEALSCTPPPEAATAVALHVALAHDHFWRGEFSQMRQVAGAVSSGGAGGAAPVIILSQVLASLADLYLARIDEARAELAEAEKALAAVPDDVLGQNLMLSAQIALAACRLERFEAARAHVRRGLRVAHDTGQSFIVPTLLRVESNVLLMTGRLAEALRAAEAGAESASAAGHDRLAMWALEAVSTAAYWTGDVDRALSSAREAVACAQRTAEPFFVGMSQIQLAAARLAGGDAAGAHTQLAPLDTGPSRVLLDLVGAHGWTVLTEAHLALGELDAAEDATVRAGRRAEATSLPQQVAAVRCARARVMLARGEAQAAVMAARDAVSRFDRAGNLVLSARARATAGAALAAAGEREAAMGELLAAESVLSAAGAARERDAAVRTLRRLGHRVRRRVPAPTGGTGLNGLSAREREVAGRVASGDTNRKVAAALFLSEKTIGSHLARIYDKLGVHSRAALAAIVARETDPRDIRTPV